MIINIMLDIDVLKIKEGSSILIYGPPHPKVSEFIIDIINFLMKSKYYVLLIDANHQITPSSLLNIDDEYLGKLCLFKPESLESVSKIIDFLIFSTIKIPDNFAVILNSLYIQISYHLWPILKYDPLYIMYGLTSLPKKKRGSLSIILLDTYVEELDLLSYKDSIKEVFDIIIKRKIIDTYVSFEVVSSSIK